jgi:hypothetical protein
MENNYTLHKSLFPSGFPAQITRCGYIHWSLCTSWQVPPFQADAAIEFVAGFDKMYSLQSFTFLKHNPNIYGLYRLYPISINMLHIYITSKMKFTICTHINKSRGLYSMCILLSGYRRLLLR